MSRSTRAGEAYGGHKVRRCHVARVTKPGYVRPPSSPSPSDHRPLDTQLAD